jgi:hypothetical protein
LYKNRNETAQKEEQCVEQYKNSTEHRIHKIENKNTKRKANIKRKLKKQ